ncbi:MAG: NAD(P)/FAD-dependent oxidoreductase [Anaerolineae bacterium]
MRSTKYLIIGGGLAGGRAIDGIRELDKEGSIILVGKEPRPPYNRPPLSKSFLRGEKPREEIFLESESYYREEGVDLLLGITVESLDPEKKQVTLSNGEIISFQKALLATGGHPIEPPIPGMALEGVHTLRTVENSAAIREEAQQGRRAVIIGAGFIGIEMAASLTQRGVHVTVIEMRSHLWPEFVDETLAGFFQDYFEEQGIHFILNETAEEFLGEEHVTSVLTKSGDEIPCDFVCVAVGIKPNVALAQEAGLEVDGGVVVNEYLQSSHPDIYAAGDIANYPDPYFNKRRRVEHWGQADYTGDLAGRNMAGAEEAYDLLTYVWSEEFDLHLEFAGDHTEADRKLQRGEFGSDSFARFFLKGGQMTAYFAINPDDDELSAWNSLIEEKADLTGKEEQLQDPGFDPADL